MKYSKKHLYKTRNLINIASYLQISENEIHQIYDEFIRELEGKKYSQKKFVDFLINELTKY